MSSRQEPEAETASISRGGVHFSRRIRRPIPKLEGVQYRADALTHAWSGQEGEIVKGRGNEEEEEWVRRPTTSGGGKGGE